jgi:cytochrome c oxidase assembly protein subunit 15
VVPPLVGGMATSFAHRLAALLLLLAVSGLALWTRQLRARRPDLYAGSLAALGAVLLQAVSGAIVAWTRVDLFSALSHAALAGLLFASLSYLCLHVLPLRGRAEPAGTRREEEVSAMGQPVTAGVSR